MLVVFSGMYTFHFYIKIITFIFLSFSMFIAYKNDDDMKSGGRTPPHSKVGVSGPSGIYANGTVFFLSFNITVSVFRYPPRCLKYSPSKWPIYALNNDGSIEQPVQRGWCNPCAVFRAGGAWIEKEIKIWLKKNSSRCFLCFCENFVSSETCF